MLPNLISLFKIVPIPHRATSLVHIYTTEAIMGLVWLTVSSTLQLSGNITIHWYCQLH